MYFFSFSSADGNIYLNRSPVTHVAYIKTHKTGSSTVASIMLEYAVTHNLTLALPSKGSGNKLGWPSLFHRNYSTPDQPDILCYHSRSVTNDASNALSHIILQGLDVILIAFPGLIWTVISSVALMHVTRINVIIRLSTVCDIIITSIRCYIQNGGANTVDFEKTTP